MATPTLFDTGIFSVIGIASELLIGAKLYWFEAGTSTPAVTYSDPGLTIPNANPVLADATGRFPEMWLGNDEFKYILVAPDGTLASPLVTVDDYVPNGAQIDNFKAELASGAGAGLVGFDQSETYAQGTVGLALMNYISVKNAPYNAVGDGIADDTAAIQQAINDAGTNQAICFPKGNYRITSTLTYTGSSGNGLTLFSFEKPGRSTAGAALSWAGASGGTMFQSTSGNNVRLENLGFNGNSLALRGFYALAPSSSGIEIKSCVFIFMKGTGSAGIQLGNNANQVSEVKISDCGFTGNGTDMDYGILTATGNVKNFLIERPILNTLNTGISFGSPSLGVASGTMTVTGAVCSTNQTDFYMQSGGGELVIIGGESENSVRFITGPGSVSGPCSIVVNGWSGQAMQCPADDYVIYNVSGKVSLLGCYFQNVRTGSSVPKINVTGLYQGGGPASSVISLGNQYINVTDRAPIYDGSLMFDSREAPDLHYVSQCISIGDGGGTNGAPIRLVSITGSMDIASVGMSAYDLASGLAPSVWGRVSRTLYKVTIPYTRWTASALSQALGLGKIPAKTRLTSIIADTTTAYAGLAGTITLRVGTAPNGQEFLVAKDVKTAATTQGLVDGDLGTSINRASAVQGGYLDWANQTNPYATLTSGTGNIGTGTVTNLTAGSTTFYFVTETMV